MGARRPEGLSAFIKTSELLFETATCSMGTCCVKDSVQTAVFGGMSAHVLHRTSFEASRQKLEDFTSLKTVSKEEACDCASSKTHQRYTA